MEYKRYLITLAISIFLCIEAFGQFTAVIEQFPDDGWNSECVSFKLSELAAALDTDAATLAGALDAWYEGEESENLFFLKQLNGLSDNYTGGNKGSFYVNAAGIPQKWSNDNSSLRWCNDIGWNYDYDYFDICMMQYAGQCAGGDEFTPVFVLKYGEKAVELCVTYKIVAQPEIPVPTTLVEKELNIVGEKEIVVEQEPRDVYKADTVKLNISDAISELGIDNELILTHLIGEILYCTDGFYSDAGLFLKKDILSNGCYFCLGAIQNNEGNETGECSITSTGKNKFNLLFFDYTPETFELSCQLSLHPGFMNDGDSYFANLYLIYGEKAYKLVYRLKIAGEISPDVVTNKDEASGMGLYYNLISKIKEAEVISNPNKYSGSIIVPQRVTYNGDVYTVTAIKESAFSSCKDLYSIIIREGVTSIGSSAFRGCSGLTSVTIPNSVTSIGSSAFYSCTGLTSVTIPNSVTSIGSSAFSSCTGLTSITIPNSVMTIGNDAFNFCGKLSSVYISDLSAWCNISFSNLRSNPLCNNSHLYLNGAEVKDLVIPNGITTIKFYAFHKCSGLTSVTIPSSVTSIEGYAFEGCSGLTSVTIPNSVTSIGWHAFDGCSGLTSVTIPNSVTNIEDSAFEGCSGLTSVTIGSSVRTIGFSAFYSCQDLTDVFCYAEAVPSTKSNAFDGSYIEYATLHVPAVAYESYRTTEPWSNFGTIKVIDGETPVVEKCATPTITFANGKVRFACETEGVEFVSTVESTPNYLQNGNELELGGTFVVSVYAVKDGYDNSDTATMTISMSQMGDVNGDGQVTVADVTSLVNKILGK